MNALSPRHFLSVLSAAVLAFACLVAPVAQAQLPPGAAAAPPSASNSAPPLVAPSVVPAMAETPTPVAVPVASPATEVTAASPGAPTATAGTPVVPESFQALDTQVQDLKQDVLDLNRDLFMLEEELLFPANTQVAVFLSMEVSRYFEIDSVQLRLDDKQVANYLYTEREVDGLNRGGVQRLYLGNVRFGQHELVAFFTGKGPNGRDYRRGATITFRKGEGAKFLELRVSDRQRNQQPEFIIKEWE
jgi:hypothetical protein